jgi:hypothetical protein
MFVFVFVDRERRVGSFDDVNQVDALHLAPIPTSIVTMATISREFGLVWRLHGDLYECTKSDEQNECCEGNQDDWDCVQHFCFGIFWLC